MRDKLIKLLGGYTYSEFKSVEHEYINQRDTVTNYRAREEYFIKQFQEEKTERLKLQEIIFKKFNILPEDPSSSIQDDPQLKPLQTAPRRMSEVLRSMEQDDQQRVRTNAKVS